MPKSNKSVKIQLQVEKALAAKNLTAFKKEFKALLKELGKTDQEIKAFEQLSRDIDRGAKSMSDLDAETRDLLKSYKQLEQITRDRGFLSIKSHAATQQEIEKVRAAYERLRKSGKLTSTELAQAAVRANEKIKDLEATTNGWKQSLVNARYELGEMAVAGAGIGYMVKQAMDFESAMADVAKVLNGTPEQVQQISSDLRDMAENSSLSATELAKIAEEGAKLGVPAEQIGKFTELAQKMAVAFDLSAEEAGQSIAKLTNIFGLTLDQVESLGDSVNQLGNNTAATEAQIIDAMVRIGGTSRQFGLAAEQAAALVDAMIAMGQPPEVAARSINVMLSKLQTANVQSKNFREGLDSIGVSAEQMANDIRENPQQALNKFLETLRNMDTQARAEAITLMFGQEHQAKIAALVNSLDQYNKALELSTNKAQAAGAMQSEFEKRMATSSAQMDKLLNTLNNIAINVGTALLPVLNDAVDVLGDGAKALADFTEANPGIVELGTLLGGIAVSAAGLKTVFLALKLGVLDFGASSVKSIKGLNVGLDVAMAKGNRLASVFNALGAAMVGWEIGSYLRENFVVAEKAGIAFTGAVQAGFRRMQGYWEAFKAAFTDDTIDAAMARMEKDVQHIQDEYQALFDEVEKRGGSIAEAQKKAAEETAKAAAAIKKEGSQATEAAPKVEQLAGATEQVASSSNKAAEAAVGVAAAAGKAAAGYLTQIQNAKTLNEVARTTATAMRELGDNTEAQALVSQAAAKKAKELDDAAKALKKTNAALAKSVVNVTDSIDENYEAMLHLQTQYDKGKISAAEFNKGISDLSEKNEKLRDKQREANKETENAADAQRDAAGATAENNQAMASAISLTHVVRNRYYEMSEAVGKYFDNTMAAVHSIEQWWDALSDRRYEQVKKQYEELVQSNDALIRRLKSGAASSEDMRRAQAALAAESINVTHGFIGLGAQDLAPLRAALADAQSRMEALRDSAESTLVSLQNELDRLNGNMAAIEQRNYEQKRLELQQKLAEAQAAGDAAAIAALQKSLQILKQIHQVKMANLDADQKAAAVAASGGVPGDTPTSSRPQTRGSISGTFAGQRASQSKHVLELRDSRGNRTEIGVTDEEQAYKFLDALEKAGLAAT